MAGSNSSPDTGVAGVAAMIADAEMTGEMAEALRAANAADPAPGGKRGDAGAGQWQPDEYGLPPECPVIPLGTSAGNFYFLDTIGQMRVINETSLGQKTINSLFMGRHHYLYWAWPKRSASADVVGFRAEKATENLLWACGIKGAFDPVAQTRGRGAWLGPRGELILHCGDVLIEGGRPARLGEIGGRVYPTRPRIPRPWPRPLSGQKGPAIELLKLLQTWNWDRPHVDPILLLGWIGAAMIGGALDYRPAVFIVGDKATGKSTLQQLVRALFGGGLIQTADTTAAGIYQQLQFDSLPVAVDEFEAKADSRRTKAILELARAAFSGDVMMRGGDSHKGVQFNARSSFLFSAINTPPLDPQDLSRQAILSLKRLAGDTPPPVIDQEKFGRLGRQIMRRMVDNWHRWPQTLQAYYETMANAGHGGRGQNTFGTLLACADMIIDSDDIELELEMTHSGEPLDRWGELLRPADMLEYEGMEENWRLCLNHILTAQIDAWRGGERHTVGEILDELWTADFVPDHERDNAWTQPEGERQGISFRKAVSLLQQCGLSLQRPPQEPTAIKLFIPNQNPLLHRLFTGSKWAGTIDAGSWMVALRQAPAGIYELGQGRINGVKSKGTLFDLGKIMGDDDKYAEQTPQATNK